MQTEDNTRKWRTEGGKKTINLSFRISPDEKRELDKRAREAGMTTSAYIVSKTLGDDFISNQK